MKTFLKYALLLIAVAMFVIGVLDIRNADRQSQSDLLSDSQNAGEASMSASESETDSVPEKTAATNKSVAADKSDDTAVVTVERAESLSEVASKDQTTTDNVSHDDETLRIISTEKAPEVSPEKPTEEELADEKPAVMKPAEDKSIKPKSTEPTEEIGEKPSKNADELVAEESANDSEVNDEAKKNALARKAVLEALDNIESRLQSTVATESKPTRNVAKLDFGALGDIGSLLGMQMQSGRDSVTVGRLLRGGPAHQAGFRSGDTVVSVDRIPVLDTKSFAAAVSAHEPGDSLDIFVKRGTSWRAITISIPKE